MVGFELFLDVVAVCFVFLLVGRDKNHPVVEVVEAPHAEAEEKAIATVPDVDLPSIGELFQVSDEVGDRYLTPQEIAARDAMRVAVGETVSTTPKRRGKGRRAYIESLFDQAEEMRQRTMVSDAALLTVATVAVNRLEGKG